jgi:hypothetical protein
MSLSGAEATARSEFPDVLAKMHRTRLVALGEAADYDLSPSPKTSEQLAKAEHLLGDPLALMRVGRFPGRGSRLGQQPSGFKEAKRLVDAQAVDSLRRVLRGPNPEGRGFAAVGLSKLNALSGDDLRVIEQLKVASSIATQGGCMVNIGPARDFLSNLESHHYLFEPSNITDPDEPE